MLKQITVVGVSLALLLTLCSCGNPKETAEENVPADLKIVDSAYVVDNGYVNFSIEVQNPNKTFAADLAVVNVTGRDENGQLSFSDDWTISGLTADSTTYWASMAGNGETEDSDDIEISIHVNDGDWTKSDATIPNDLYEINNLSVTLDDFAGVNTAGWITLTQDMNVLGNNVTSPVLVCILRDADGRMVAGFSDSMLNNLTVGEATQFAFSSYFEAPEFVTFDLYANPI